MRLRVMCTVVLLLLSTAHSAGSWLTHVHAKALARQEHGCC